MKYWGAWSYGKANYTTDVPEARKRAMPRLLGVLRGRRSWQGRVGCHRRPLEEDRFGQDSSVPVASAKVYSRLRNRLKLSVRADLG